MLHELFPDAKNIGLLYCSAEPNSLYQVETIQGYLKELGYTCKMYSFSDSNDLSSVATTAASESDVIYVPTDNTVASNTAILDNICRPAKVPVIAGEEGICAGCGVATLSISYYDLGTATGKMAAKILNGEDISDHAHRVRSAVHQEIQRCDLRGSGHHRSGRLCSNRAVSVRQSQIHT